MPAKKDPLQQLSIFNVALFLVLLASVEYFFMGGMILLAPNFPFVPLLGEIVLVLFVLLLALETGLVLLLDKKGKDHFFTPMLLTHLPWLLAFALPLIAQLTLPEPHNFLTRKIELLFGLIWVTHIFLFSGWLLWRVRGNGKPVSYTFALVSIFFFVGTTLWTTQCDLSGDEPHYLLMAYSLIHDKDLDLTNNYQNKDYEQFYHRGELQPQGLEHVIEGRRYSHHPLGPVLLVLPGFFLLGRLGAALTISLLTALALYLTLRVLEMTGAKGRALQAVAAVGLFSSPFLLFAGLIFPEVPTACLVALTLLLFVQKRWFWLGVTQGAFLWMHNRNVLLVIPFLLVLAYEFLKDKKWFEKTKLFTAGFAIPTILLAFYFHAIYGVWTPLGAHNEPFTSLFRLNHFWIGLLGLLLDQECGLWFHFAIFGMTSAGALMLWSSKNPLRFLAIGALLFYYLFMAFYENLGLTPGTRYFVGVTPLMLFMLYFAFAKLKFSVWEILTLVSFIGGVLINWVLAVIPWMRYNKLEGESMLLKTLGGILHTNLTISQPAFQAPVITAQSYEIAGFWFVVTIGLSFWFWRENK